MQVMRPNMAATRAAMFRRMPVTRGSTIAAAMASCRRSTSSTRCTKGFDDIPSLPDYPLVGSTHYLRTLPNTPREKTGPNLFSVLSQLYERHPLYQMHVSFLGTVLVETDPVEFTKVIQSEGRHPYGLVPAFTEPYAKWTPALYGLLPFRELFGRGEEHFEARRFINNGLFAPRAARAYNQVVSEAVALSSPSVPDYAEDFGEYLSLMAFEAFAAVFFGEIMRLTDPRFAGPENLRFAANVRSFSTDESLGSVTSIALAYLGYQVGYRTQYLRRLDRLWTELTGHSEALIRRFEAARNAHALTDTQKKSYLFAALGGSEATHVDLQRLIEMGQVMLGTSPDATPLPLAWVFANLACHQDVQDRLAEVLWGALKGGPIPDDMLAAPSSHPATEYLQAVLRESHRIRPSAVFPSYKRPVRDVTLHGFAVPAETTVLFDAYSMQNDPRLVPQPDLFRPERFLREAVQARKGTPAAVLDHVALKEPFGVGARMCPAARVVGIELQAIVAKLVQDWRFELADQSVTSAMDLALYPPYQSLGFAAARLPKLVITPRTHS